MSNVGFRQIETCISIWRSAPANIHLRTLSSGDTHPRASNVILAYGHDYIGHSHNIRISGDHVAICWSGKLLSIWNWKSGVLQMVSIS